MFDWNKRGLTMADLQKRLDEIERLEKNWDSYGANSASPRCIERARLLARAVAGSNVSIVPMNDGRISFSWLDESVEIVVSGTGSVCSIDGDFNIKSV